MKMEIDDKRRRNLLVLFVVMFVFGLYLLLDNRNEPVKVAYYPTFKTLIQQKSFSEVNIVEKGYLYGKIRKGPDVTVNEPEKPILKLGSGVIVSTPTPNDPKLAEALETSGTKYTYVIESGSFLSSPFFSIFLTIVFFIFIFWMINRQTGKGQQDAMRFAKSKAKLLNENAEKVTFADVAGCEEVKAEVQEVVAFLKDPKQFSRLGAKIPKGIMLIGSPGTGKTLLGRAVAGEAGVPFFSISGSSFVEMFVGVGAARVRDLFDEAKKRAPCIIFIDEIDAIGRQRGAGLGGGHDEREQTLNQILVEMDGAEANSGVIMLAATNRPDILDPALTRPGRFDRMIPIMRPDITGREEILKVHTKKLTLAADVDLKIIARMTPGASGADLANLCNEAALTAGRRNGNEIITADFITAAERIVTGPERKGIIFSEQEKKITAYHETGHAATGLLVGKEIGQVTIIPHGFALGLTIFVPNENAIKTRKELFNDIIMTLGGRAAEETILEIETTGASNDIKQANSTARSMVTKYGMSGLGLISPEDAPENPFFGKQTGLPTATSELTASSVDTETRRIIDEAYKTAKNLLLENRPLVDELAGLLLLKETVRAEELQALVAKHKK